LFSKEGAFFLGEFGPLPNENALFLGEVVFFTRELFLLHGEHASELYLIFFFGQGNDFLKEINFKNYLNVIWIFSSIFFVEKNNWEKDFRPFN
jgi:hypothetical protein